MPWASMMLHFIRPAEMICDLFRAMELAGFALASGGGAVV
jgi:hypothetical protein